MLSVRKESLSPYSPHGKDCKLSPGAYKVLIERISYTLWNIIKIVQRSHSKAFGFNTNLQGLRARVVSYALGHLRLLWKEWLHEL